MQAIELVADVYDRRAANEPHAGHEASAARWRDKLPPAKADQ